MKRKVIRIDQARCNGCGLCFPNCKEGALQIINGKALLISDAACDGLGACLGHCPQDAISIEEREAQPFDQNAALAAEISNWPIQLKLVPVNAGYFNNADLLICADCVPFAYSDFHRQLMKDKIILVGCPKLDDLDFYREKIKQIIKTNRIRSITYAYMEVPCCLGLLGIIKEAITSSTKDIPFKQAMISLKGERVL